MSARLSGSGINFGSRSFEELEGSQHADQDRASLLGKTTRRMSRGGKAGSPLEEEEQSGDHEDDFHAKPAPKLAGWELRARRKVSTLELFKFATFKDILLMILGSLFSVFEGAGPSVMALVFGGMTNTLVTTVQSGFAPEPGTQLVNATVDQTPVAPGADGTTQPGAPTAPQFTSAQFEAEISKYAVYYVYIGLAIYLSSLIQISCWQTSCERQVYRIRRAFFHSIVRQELAWFDKNQSGELSAKFNDDIDRVREGIGEQFSEMIKYLSSFASGFVVGFVVSWRLTLVILAVSPLLALFSAYLGRMLATSTQREQEKYASAGALAEEVLTSVRTVFALNGQRNEIKNYTRRLNEGKRMAFIKYFKLSLMFGASMFVLYSTYGLALYVSTELLATGLITPGSAMTVIVAVMFAAGAMGNIVPPFQTIVMAKASANLIYEIIESVPRIDALSERGLKLSKVTANVKFENVTFAYPLRKSSPVIKNLSLEVNQGQTVAICGRTGSGKSTIMNLLLRFYDPQEGSVYLDNCNLCDLNVAWLRSLVGIVEQEPALFDCSIYENIALGAIQDGDRAYARIIEAAKLANAHDFIVNLPDGYNTRCGDRGVQMSGGQKQRISIARALLSDPKMLLLDEATSALDSESEFMVQSALNKARQGRTTIIIAHRLSTIRDADLICVMENGVIVEQGRHEDLMAKKGAYHDLVTNQVFTDETNETSQQQVAPGGGGNKGDEPKSAQDPASRLGLDSDSAADEEDGERREEDDDDDVGRRKTFTFRGLKSEPGGGGDDDESSSLLSSEAQLRRAGATGGRAPLAASASKKPAGASTTMYESINRPIKSLVEFQKEQTDEVVLPKFGDIIRLIRPELPRYSFAILAAIVAGALLPTFAIFYAQIFDTFTKTGDELKEAGEFWSLMFLALAGANFIALFLRITTMSTTIEITLARLRIQCFNTIMRQHVGWFDSANHSPQRLTTRLATDVPQVKAVLNARLANLISGVATITASLIVAFYLGWQLAMLLTVALPLLLYMGYLQMKVSRGDQQSYVKRMENASRLATEVFEHVKLVQAINQERYFFEKFSRELQLPLREGLKTARRFGMIYGLSQSIIYFVYGASFRWGAYLMAREILTPTTVYRVFFAISFTAVAVGQWGGLSGNMARANYAIGLIMRLLGAQPQIDNLSRGGIKPRLQGALSLQDIHFRYPTRPDTQVLQGLSLEVRAGQTLALVGPSGQGKSTIGALLLRFYDPDRGVVRIDNYDIRCINLNHLRQSIGLVSQEPVLFKASIKDNILYGMDKSRYSMREVVQAAKLANIDEFIASLPQKYDTQVGDRGSQMSGGQKQRIAIARTMIRNPTILILDEATSALDAESEALVNQALEKAAKGKTCIKIAHRLSTVRDADQIAVIEQGSIVEIGTHDELMALGKKGHYFRLMQKQDISS